MSFSFHEVGNQMSDIAFHAFQTALRLGSLIRSQAPIGQGQLIQVLFQPVENALPLADPDTSAILCSPPHSASPPYDAVAYHLPPLWLLLQ